MNFMPLLNFFKNPKPQTCCCEGDGCCTPEEADSQDCCSDCCPPKAKSERFIKVLGGGCKNCHKLMENTQEALKSLGMDDPVELVSEMAVIAGYGVMSTPALVVDGKVVSMGRVLSPEQAAQAIRGVRGK
jgi:small redox-active disulfide protein 2